MLAHYKAAWDALNPDALAAVQLLSAAERRSVRNSMNQMREYAMGIDIQDLKVSQDGRSATAVCRVTHRFQGSVSGRQEQTVTSTFLLEKRGDNWMITGLR